MLPFKRLVTTILPLLQSGSFRPTRFLASTTHSSKVHNDTYSRINPWIKKVKDITSGDDWWEKFPNPWKLSASIPQSYRLLLFVKVTRTHASHWWAEKSRDLRETISYEAIDFFSSLNRRESLYQIKISQLPQWTPLFCYFICTRLVNSRIQIQLLSIPILL